jgi:N-acetyl-gamma-glutamylphosphate reductase
MKDAPLHQRVGCNATAANLALLPHVQAGFD